MSRILIPTASSFVLSTILVAMMLRLSHRKSWYDRINERKIHTGDIPRLGGVGFAFAFIIIAACINFFSPIAFHFKIRFFPALLALVLILITGIRDDFSPIAPRYKLILHIIAAFGVVLPGYVFQRLFFINLGNVPLLSLVLYPLSFLWIVGLTNAINLIDGVDGLAGGISFLAALSYALVFTAMGNSEAAVLLCLCLAAVICGFLLFNVPVPKAKIFMGDGGAYFLGFILALLPLINVMESPGLPLPYAVALLAIPIFDTFAAMWRRIRDGRRIDSPDRFHIHHKLINLGLDARGVDGVLYGLQILTGCLVFLSVKYREEHTLSLLLLGVAYLLVLGFFSTVHFMNQKATAKNAPPAERGA